MTMIRTLLVALALVFLASAAQAQAPHGPGMPPGDGPGFHAGDGPPQEPGMGPQGKGPQGDMKRKMEAWREGRDPAEVEAYEKSIHKIRERSEIYLQMAKILVDKKEFAKALETVRKVIAIEIPDGPFKPEMLRKKAHVYLMAADIAQDAGMADEAAKLVAEGIEAAKGMPDVAVGLYKKSAEMLRKAGKLDEALRLLEKAAELSESAKE